MTETIEIRDDFSALLKRHVVPAGGSGLRGAVLLGAERTGAQLAGAKYDSKTQFPVGFHPGKAGMLRVESD
ncbi:hypothetical protein [Synechococcus sp. CCY 9618]|uniref:hypothetical protein n=1 Tax=Synechococcus sp. CCY 9618 TaxID=2815602 RepID=UPI001C21C8EA|nr:hypothetical protein [Synechococcus sp. CCY 9618]